MEEVTIIGGGGHAKVLIDCIEEEQKYKINFVVDDNEELHHVLDYPVFRMSHLQTVKKPTSIIAIGDGAIRKKIVAKVESEYITSIHPKAVVSKYAQLGKGTHILAGAVVNAATVIGEHCIINTGCIVEHDCVISDFVHLSPNTSIGGGVTIGECTQIGIGASVIQNITIGANVMIGAGAVVISDIPDNCTAVGVPAKPIKFKS